VETLKTNQQLPLDCELRQVKYLNNLIEQDRRFIKRRTRPGRVLFLRDGATHTGRLRDNEHDPKRQMKGAEKGDILAQIELINQPIWIVA